MAHIYNGILLSHKKELNNAICSNMNGPRDYQTKWSKPQRERQISYNTYMWNLQYDTNELIYETETERHREQTCGCQGGVCWERHGLRAWDLAGSNYYIENG